MVNYFELDEETEEKIYDLQGQTAGKVRDYLIDLYPQLPAWDVLMIVYDAISNSMCITAEEGIDGCSASSEIEDGLKLDFGIEITEVISDEIEELIEEDNIEYEKMFEEEEE